jgi:hypothetical protein
MADARPHPAVHRSVFAKLVSIMLVMALCLMGLVAGFFVLFVNPVVGASVDRMLGDYARRIAADSPSREDARRSPRLALQLRYEGPTGSWTTDETSHHRRGARRGAGHWVSPRGATAATS